MTRHEYVVIIPRSFDERDRARAISDVQYKGYTLDKIEDCPGRPDAQIARFYTYRD